MRSSFSDGWSTDIIDGSWVLDCFNSIINNTVSKCHNKLPICHYKLCLCSRTDVQLLHMVLETQLCIYCGNSSTEKIAHPLHLVFLSFWFGRVGSGPVRTHYPTMKLKIYDLFWYILMERIIKWSMVWMVRNSNFPATAFHLMVI